MSNVDQAWPDQKLPAKKDQTKKTYSKPEFRFERVFETQALSCGKVSGTQTQCQINRKTS